MSREHSYQTPYVTITLTAYKPDENPAINYRVFESRPGAGSFARNHADFDSAMRTFGNLVQLDLERRARAY